MEKQLVDTFPEQFDIVEQTGEHPTQYWVRDETFTRVDMMDQILFCQPHDLVGIGPYLEHCVTTRAGVPSHRRCFPSSKITGRIKPIVDQKKQPIIPFMRSASLRRDCELGDLEPQKKPIAQQVRDPAPPRNSSAMNFATQAQERFLR